LLFFQYFSQLDAVARPPGNGIELSVLARTGTDPFHVLFATDLKGDNARIVTACRPDSNEWLDDLKTRRSR
jgi:hypothetical protein